MKRLLIVPAVALMSATILAGCGGSDPASGGATTAAGPITVRFDEGGCMDARFDAPTAGFVDIRAINEAGKRGEVEIVSSEPAIKHETYLAPGEADDAQVLLQAGTYTVICFNTNAKKRATLVVGDSGDATTDTSSTPASTVARELAPVAARYTTYVRQEARRLTTETRRFTDAVRAGDLAQAKALYAEVRRPWEAIEPIAEAFPDADAAIDSRADDHPKGEADPGFTGFHALEYGLWAQGSKKGAKVDLNALATRLDRDVAALAAQVQGLDVSPSQMVGGAAALIDEAAQTKVTGEEERYSHTDLATLAANLDGAQKIVTLITPALREADPALLASIERAAARVRAVLKRYEAGDGMASYTEVSAADKARLKTAMADLAEQLSLVAGTLGLEVQ